MSKFIRRVIVGGSLAALGGAVGGPAGAYAGWKVGGTLATGNPLHLIPGGGLFADGMDAASSAADLVFADDSIGPSGGIGTGNGGVTAGGGDGKSPLGW